MERLSSAISCEDREGWGGGGGGGSLSVSATSHKYVRLIYYTAERTLDNNSTQQNTLWDEILPKTMSDLDIPTVHYLLLLCENKCPFSQQRNIFDGSNHCIFTFQWTQFDLLGTFLQYIRTASDK